MDEGKDGPPARSGVQDDGSIAEGLANILPNNVNKRADGRDDVFYNPAQVYNRDLSSLVISVFAEMRAKEKEAQLRKREEKAKARTPPVEARRPPEGLLILEALAATGIRSIRYAKELGTGCKGIRKIVANDIDQVAVDHMKKNRAHNSVSEERMEVVCGDAALFMYMHRAKGLGDEAYDVIDVDPYGSCAPFVDAAVQCVADGGLMCITSTDMPVLGGNHPETCFARYGGSTLKTAGYIHEMALRVILHSIATAAAKYGREIRPLLSCSIDFYVRVFVQVFDSPARAKLHASRTGLVHQCGQCEAFYIQPLGEALEEEKKGKQDKTSKDAAAATSTKFRPAKVVTPGTVCDECSEGRHKVGGPLYISPIFDPGFVERCLSAAGEGSSRLPGVTSWKKLTSLLTAISEESNDVPLFYKLPSLCKGLKVNSVPLKQFRGTLKELGYQVSHFHREPEAVKTDAPPHVVYDLMRIWAEEHAPKNCPMPALLNKTIRLKRPFEWATGESGEAPSAKVPKFLPNPEANWGPKKAARGGGGGGEEGEARAKDAAASEEAVKPPS